MIALQITELKSFMGKLLKTPVFDDFLLQEATLQMGISYVIDGHINETFYQNDEAFDDSKLLPEFISYGEVRNTLYSLIKGKRTPLGLQVVLQLSSERCSLLFPEGTDAHMIKGLLFNIRYDGAKAMITSAVSYYSFSLNKTPELIWDEALMTFLRTAGIAFEQI